MAEADTTHAAAQMKMDNHIHHQMFLTAFTAKLGQIMCAEMEHIIPIQATAQHQLQRNVQLCRRHLQLPHQYVVRALEHQLRQET